ncbi:MAG TPA: TonB-dependent receptor [Anaeromyxobacteraceae bacterium]|nr:TonB-dependent receptor [Anaeromyxobacteraceae bacterium]
MSSLGPALLLVVAIGAQPPLTTPPPPTAAGARPDSDAPPPPPPPPPPDDEGASDVEVTVRAERPVAREPTIRVVEAEEVARVPGSQGDTLKAVLNFPGVGRAPFSGGNLVLRGASPGDSQVFLEGQEIPILYHFGGLRSTFNPRFLEAVEFVPGNFAPDYGRAIGGIVNVRVRDPARDELRGDATASVYDAGVALEGPLSRTWSLGGAFHRSYIDVILPRVLPSDANVSFDTAPRYYDYQLVSSWSPRAGERARVFFYGSLDKLQLVFKEPQDDPSIRGTLRGRVMFHALQGSWERPVGPLRQQTSIQLTTQQIDTAVGNDIAFKLDVQRISVRSTWSARVSRAVEARAGVDVRWAWAGIDARTPQPPEEGEPPLPVSARPRIAVKKSSEDDAQGAFAELRVEPGAGVTLLPGVRLDRYGAIDRWTLDPRLNVRWAAWRDTVLKGGIGVYQQDPEPQESDRDIGTPDLRAERSVHASAGVERRIVEGVDLDVTVFRKWLDRLVVRNPAFEGDPTQRRFTNEGEGRIYGLELELRARLGPSFTGFVAYTYQRSLRTDRPGEAERPFDYDQPHILTIAGTRDLRGGWAVGARFRLVSGNPFTPITDSVYVPGNDVYVPLFGAVNSDRLAPFHALDVRIDKTWQRRGWKAGVFLDVQNVYNRGNPEGWNYRYDYRQRTPLTGLPILPILGARAEW